MLFKRYRELYRDRCKSATWNIQHGLKTGKKSAYISIEHWFKKETNRKGTENVTPHFISEICGFEIANCCFVIVIYIYITWYASCWRITLLWKEKDSWYCLIKSRRKIDFWNWWMGINIFYSVEWKISYLFCNIII